MVAAGACAACTVRELGQVKEWRHGGESAGTYPGPPGRPPGELPFNLSYVEKRAKVLMEKMRKEPEFQEALLTKFTE